VSLVAVYTAHSNVAILGQCTVSKHSNKRQFCGQNGGPNSGAVSYKQQYTAVVVTYHRALTRTASTRGAVVAHEQASPQTILHLPTHPKWCHSTKRTIWNRQTLKTLWSLFMFESTNPEWKVQRSEPVKALPSTNHVWDCKWKVNVAWPSLQHNGVFQLW